MGGALLLGGLCPAGGMEVSAGDVPTQAPDLVARILAGDRSAEEQLVRTYSRGIMTFIRYNMADQRGAEDLHQDVLRITLEKIRRGAVREPERLSGFICGIARNLIVEHFRRGSHENASTDLAAGSGVADSAPTPVERLLRQENARIVRQVLSEVRPVRYQAILYRYYVAEEEKEQICADLRMNSLQFNRVLDRARDRYRALYLRALEKQNATRWDNTGSASTS